MCWCRNDCWVWCLCLGLFSGVCVISGFFNVDVQEEHLLMPTAEVTFSNENLRFLALKKALLNATTGSTKYTWLSLFVCFVEIFLSCFVSLGYDARMKNNFIELFAFLQVDLWTTAWTGQLLQTVKGSL